MKDTFDKIYPDLKMSEGGFANDPKDSGGPTYVGITLKNYRLQVDPKATVDTIKNLTDDQIKDYYRKFYWNKVNGDLLPAGIDYSVFDFGVNSGPATAVKKLQGIVGTTPDGIVGNQTLAAVANKSQEQLIEDYSATRLDYIKQIPGWAWFSNDWTKRILRVKQKSLQLASGIQTQDEQAQSQVKVDTVNTIDVAEKPTDQVATKNILDLVLVFLRKLF